MRQALDVWKNRAALLHDLRQQGVEIRLHGDGLVFFDPRHTLSEGQRAGLELCRDGIIQQLRRERGLCLTCGREEARKDSRLCPTCQLTAGRFHLNRLTGKRKYKTVEATPTEPTEAPGLVNAEFTFSEREDGE